MVHPPVRADHIGSLLRPAPLRQAFRAFHAGEIDDVRFAAAQDAAIRDAVKLQEDIGLAVVTDGEFRRGSYWSRFVERTEVSTLPPRAFSSVMNKGRSLPSLLHSSPAKWRAEIRSHAMSSIFCFVIPMYLPR
jgi:5-methyltetrahydropteroyltriglutamate--homocysteine methyltransferase